MKREPSWPWQPPRHRLSPPVRAILSFLGWGIVIIMAFLASTYLLDFFIA